MNFGRKVIPALIAGTICCFFIASANAEPTQKPAQPPLTPPPANCPETVSGRTIAYALMALKATDNCEKFPYTKKEVQAYIDHLKCNAKAKATIEKLGPRYMERFDYLFYAQRRYQTCKQARHFKPTVRTR